VSASGQAVGGQQFDSCSDGEIRVRMLCLIKSRQQQGEARRGKCEQGPPRSERECAMRKEKNKE